MDVERAGRAAGWWGEGAGRTQVKWNMWSGGEVDTQQCMAGVEDDGKDDNDGDGEDDNDKDQQRKTEWY